MYMVVNSLGMVIQEMAECGYTHEDCVDEAINLLQIAINHLKGEGPKPTTNNSDTVNIIVNAFKDCGIK